MPKISAEFGEYQLPDDSTPKERARKAQELEQNLFNSLLAGSTPLDRYAIECQGQFRPLLAYGRVYPDLSEFNKGFINDDKTNDRRRAEYLKHIGAQWDIFSMAHNVARLSYSNIGLMDLPEKPPVIITVFVDVAGKYRPEARIQFDYQNLVEHYTVGIHNKDRPRYEVIRAARELFIGYATSTGEMLGDYYKLHPNFFMEASSR